MERFIIYAVGIIIMLIGLYVLVFNIPIEGDVTGRYGNWTHENMGGTPILLIGLAIYFVADFMEPDKKKD